MATILVICISSSKVFVQKMCEMIDEGKFNIKIPTYTNERIEVLVQNTWLFPTVLFTAWVRVPRRDAAIRFDLCSACHCRLPSDWASQFHTHLCCSRPAIGKNKYYSSKEGNCLSTASLIFHKVSTCKELLLLKGQKEGTRTYD